MRKLAIVFVALGLTVGCSDSSTGDSSTNDSSTNDSSSGDSSNDTMTGSQTDTDNTATESSTDTSTPDTSTGTVANASSLIGRWQFCIPAELLEDDDSAVSRSQGLVFGDDGIFRGYLAAYQEPDCQGEETFIPPGLDPVENEQRYTVVGTATSSEGLNVFEVLTQLEGSVDDTTYYHIDGDTLLVAEDFGTGDGIITAFNQPYIKQ